MNNSGLINHEFGYPAQRSLIEYIKEIKKRRSDIVVIEDCAHAFFSKSNEIGDVGDYIIYSLPKSFGMQVGALLVANGENASKIVDKTSTEKVLEKYVLYYLAEYIPHVDEYVNKQLKNYKYLVENLREFGIRPFFGNYVLGKEGCVPAVFYLDGIMIYHIKN